MLSLWRFFLERRSFTWLLMGTLVVAGILAVVAIPKESAPEVEVPVGIVTTVLPGASALDVEKLVTARLENEVANVENMDTLTSTSRDGVSVITAEFTASADLDKAIADLKEAVDRAVPRLPSDAQDPVVTRVSFSEQPIMLISVASGSGGGELTRLGDALQNELQTVAGVSRIDVSGVAEREINIIVRRDALMQYGLSVSEIVGAIRAGNTALPIGVLTIGPSEYSIRFDGSADTAEEIAAMPVALREGEPVYVRDIAVVADGLAKTASYSRISQKGAPAENALTLSVYKKAGGDITRVSSAVLAKLEELKESTLAGSPYVVTYDAGEQVATDLSELSQTGLETVALVMIALLLTIGWREAVVAGLSIPLSFVIAFIGLYAADNTINFVSLFSLILAIGILVDSGIVVAEAVHTRTHRLGSAYRAALATLEEYAWPLIAGTMTTVAVFVPLFFLSGVTGEFIKSIPFTLVFVLLASIVVALGFVPLLALAFSKKHLSDDRLTRAQEALTMRLQHFYSSTLGALLDSPRRQKQLLWGLAASFFIVFLLPVTGLLKVVFFPGGDSNLLIIELEQTAGTPLPTTDLAVRVVEELLYENPYIESFVTTVGSGSSFGSGGIGGGAGSGHLANITLNLYEDRDKDSVEIQEELRSSLDAIPGLVYRILSEEGGPPTGAPIVLKIIGDDLNDIARVATLLERELTSSVGTKDVTTSAQEDGLELVLTVDRARAAELGVSPSILADTLRTAITGAIASSIETGTEDIDIRVRLDLNTAFRDPSEAAHASLDEVRQIPLVTPQGTVLLGSLVAETAEQGRSSIRREDRERYATVSSYVTEGANAIEIGNALMEKVPELGIPEGVRVELSGENEEVNRSFAEMGIALVAGLLLMLGVLVLEFNSFRYGGYILIIVPLTLIGVLIGLTILGQPLSFPSMLGVIALAGVVVNHAIILMDSMLHLRGLEPTIPLRELVIRSSIARLRPILLTTLTTAVGMIPLMTVSALWTPLATAVLFGMLFSLVLTLVTIPVLVYRYPGKALLPRPLEN